MLKFYKILFSSTLIFSTLMVITSSSWLGMWMGLEINLMSIIPLMNNSKSMLNSEAALKYFLTQALASAILLFSLIFLSKELFYIKYNYTLMIMFNSALFMKMGAAPFHFWFPEIIEGLNWTNNFILLTWQKIAPFNLLFLENTLFFSMIIIGCMLVSGILGLNQIKLKKILAYSSINHIGWMIASLIFLKMIWFFYFIVYSIISFNLILIFKKFSINNLIQLFYSLNQNKILKILFISNFISLAVLPPFLGFMPKWLTIQFMLKNQMFFLSLVMVILTLLTMFYYMRIIANSLMINTSQLNSKEIFKIKSFYLIFLTNLISLMSLFFVTLSINFI